jgi:hypothetical protein
MLIHEVISNIVDNIKTVVQRITQSPSGTKVPQKTSYVSEKVIIKVTEDHSDSDNDTFSNLYEDTVSDTVQTTYRELENSDRIEQHEEQVEQDEVPAGEHANDSKVIDDVAVIVSQQETADEYMAEQPDLSIDIESQREPGMDELDEINELEQNIVEIEMMEEDNEIHATDIDMESQTNQLNLKPKKSSELVHEEIKRHFDFSAHPEISQVNLSNFLNEGVIEIDSLRYVDALIMDALKSVNLIGELPISEEAFTQISQLVRDEYIVQGKPKYKKMYPALFMTTMVFSARYSDLNARSFWEPYAKLVWNLDSASQYMQLQCRDHFLHCRRFLSDNFPHLTFKIKNEGDVTRPVFQHVLIPYYLQDYFAVWLLQNFKTILETPVDLLPEILKQESSLRYIPPRLQRFITDSDTADTAATLILQMSEAISAYRDREDIDIISEMMTSPIERSIWKTIAEQLITSTEIQELTRQSRPSLEWIWSLNDSELQLRLTNVNDIRRPDLCVWIDQNTIDPLDASIMEYIIPWEQSDGTYLLDEVILQDGPINGKIVVLSDEYDGSDMDIIFSRSVSSLPDSPAIFFRLTQEQAYGVPISQPTNAGDWLICLQEGVSLSDQYGNNIVATQKLYVPEVLRQHGNFVEAGQFPLSFPLIIKRGNQTIETIEESKDSKVLTVSVSGLQKLEATAPNTPPVFLSNQIILKTSNIEMDTSQVALSIRSRGEFHKVVWLNQLPIQQKDNYLLVNLSEIIPNESASYRINLRQNLKSLLLAPIEFSVLTNVSIIPPDLAQTYTPFDLPTVQIMGVQKSNIIVQSNIAKTTEFGEQVTVQWKHFPSQLIHMGLALNNQVIPLSWQIKRFYTWIEDIPIKVVNEGDLRKIMIHVRGNRYESFDWIVGDAKRQAKLDANGQLDLELRHDTLIDMIRSSKESITFVSVRYATSEWLLFEYQNHPSVTHANVTYHKSSQQLDVEIHISPTVDGDYKLQIQSEDGEESQILKISEGIGEQHTFDITLNPGHYSFLVAEKDHLLEFDGSVTNTFSVEDDLPVMVIDDYSESIIHDKLQLAYTMKMPAYMFQKHRTNLWGPLAKVLLIRDADHWVENNGLLPAWCVTNHRIRAYLGNRRYLYIEPELASHKGRLALRVLNHYPKSRKQYWGNYLWSRGYCVSPAGLDEDKTRKYVKWQEGQEKRSEPQ